MYPVCYSNINSINHQLPREDKTLNRATKIFNEMCANSQLNVGKTSNCEIDLLIRSLGNQLKLNLNQINRLSDALLEKIEFNESYKTLYILIQLSKLQSLNNVFELYEPWNVFVNYIQEERLSIIESLRPYSSKFNTKRTTKFLNPIYIDSLIQDLNTNGRHLGDFIKGNYSELFLSDHLNEFCDYGKIEYENQIREICDSTDLTIENVDRLESLLYLYAQLDTSKNPQIGMMLVDIKEAMIRSLNCTNTEPVHPTIKQEFLDELRDDLEDIDATETSALREDCLPYVSRIEQHYGKLWKEEELETVKLYQTLKARLSSVHGKISLLSKNGVKIPKPLRNEKQTLLTDIGSLFPNGAKYEVATSLISDDETFHADEILSDAIPAKKIEQAFISQYRENLDKTFESPASLETSYRVISLFVEQLHNYDQMVYRNYDMDFVEIINAQIVFWANVQSLSNSDALKNSAKKNITTLTNRIYKRNLVRNDELIFEPNRYQIFLDAHLPYYISSLEGQIQENSSDTIDESKVSKKSVRFGLNQVKYFESFAGTGSRPSSELYDIN